jgi:hypothetical protein
MSAHEAETTQRTNRTAELLAQLTGQTKGTDERLNRLAEGDA